jgi:hypothetical protein
MVVVSAGNNITKSTTMKPKIHRVCTFLFNNGTSITVAVQAYDAEMDDRPFEEMLADAKRIGWNGDENHGRGNLKSFTVGELIVLP